MSVGQISAKAISRSALGVVVATCRANAAVTSFPAPCLAVEANTNRSEGYAILREPGERQRTILATFDNISGIEDQRLLAADAPNFFADAWRERHWLLNTTKGEDAPPDGFALGINSELTRSQDRFHIHIACLRPDVQSALAPRVVAVNPNRFARLNFKLAGTSVWAMRLDAADTMDFNPIQVLTDKMPNARTQLGHQTLIVVRETLPDGRPTIVLFTNLASGSGSNRFSVERFLGSNCS